MRPDHYIGAVIAFGLLSGLASIGRNPTVQSVSTAVKRGIDEPPVVEIKTLPDPAESSGSEASERSHPQNDISPPQLPDVVRPAVEGAFIMQTQPPRPPGPDITLGPIGIPTRDGPPGVGGGPVIDFSQLDQQPVAKFQGKPVYPYDMKREGVSGEVLVDFIVDQNGEVRNAYAVRSTRREFEAAAVQAVSKWKFKPGKKDARVVSSHLQVPIVFHLGEERE